MDRALLHETALVQLICTKCSNYLSVGPVTVTAKGQTLCGRCHSDNEIEVLSLYNLIAGRLIFKCISHYGGCKQLLLFNGEAKAHEKYCKPSSCQCPFCEYKGNGCQLVHHFKADHPGYLVKDNVFQVILSENFSCKVIYVKDSCILCMNVLVTDKYIEIFNALVAPTDQTVTQFKLRFFRLGDNVEFVSPPIETRKGVGSLEDVSPSAFHRDQCNVPVGVQLQNSYLLERAAVSRYFQSGWCLCTVELLRNRSNEELGLVFDQIVVTENSGLSLSYILQMTMDEIRRYVNTELRLKQKCVICGRCAVFFYLCPSYHLGCFFCVIQKKKCSKCDLSRWNGETEVHRVSLSCEWNNCPMKLNFFEYLKHKQECVFRQFKCPEASCTFSGQFNYFIYHFHVRPLRTGVVLKLSPKENTTETFYWRVDNEVVYVKIETRCKIVYVQIYEEHTTWPIRFEYVLRFDNQKLVDGWTELEMGNGRYVTTELRADSDLHLSYNNNFSVSFQMDDMNCTNNFRIY